MATDFAISAASAAPSGLSSDVGLRGLDTQKFLDLMIAELQNQDPLNPLDNTQMLSQIAQMRQIGATDQLTDTLTAISLGQKLAGATSLIGKKVSAVDATGAEVSGVVERVTLRSGEPVLHIGEQEVSLSNVKQIENA